MAKIARLHCPGGHLMRWMAGKKAYVHARVVDRDCTLSVDPLKTTWS